MAPDPTTRLGQRAANETRNRKAAEAAEAEAKAYRERVEAEAKAEAIERRRARHAFAAAVLQGMLAGTEPGARWPSPREAAVMSWRYADALLEDETTPTGDPA